MITISEDTSDTDDNAVAEIVEVVGRSMEVLTIDVLEGARESILDLVGGSKYLA